MDPQSANQPVTGRAIEMRAGSQTKPWPTTPAPGDELRPAANPLELWQTAQLMLLTASMTAGDSERDPSARLGEVIDRSIHYWLGRWTMGFSPITLGQAYADWALHMAISPGKQVQLVQKAIRKTTRMTMAGFLTLGSRPLTIVSTIGTVG